jgi:hypothetical protein
MDENPLFAKYLLPGTVLFQPVEGASRTIKGDLAEISFRSLGAYTKDKVEKDMSVRFLLMSKEHNVRLGGVGRISFVQPVVRKSQQMFKITLEFTNVDSELLRDVMMRLANAPRAPGGGAES